MRTLPSSFEHLTSFHVFEVFFIIILMEQIEQKEEDSMRLFFFLSQSEKIVAFRRQKPSNLERVGKTDCCWDKLRFYSSFFSMNIYQGSITSLVLDLQKGKVNGKR